LLVYSSLSPPSQIKNPLIHKGLRKKGIDNNKKISYNKHRVLLTAFSGALWELMGSGDFSPLLLLGHRFTPISAENYFTLNYKKYF